MKFWALPEIAGAALAVLFFCAPSWASRLFPLLSYEYTTGSSGYYSHSATGGFSWRFPRLKWSGFYSLFTDNDYSAVHTGTVRLTGYPNPDMEASGAVIFSGGRLKEDDGRNSSTALDLDATRYYGRRWLAGVGYRYTAGSLSAGFAGDDSGSPFRTAREEWSEQYRTHTFSGSAEYECAGKLRGLSLSLRLALTFNSDRSKVYSQTLETYYLLPRRIYLGIAYALNQNTGGSSPTYLSFSISKYF